MQSSISCASGNPGSYMQLPDLLVGAWFDMSGGFIGGEMLGFIPIRAPVGAIGKGNDLSAEEI